MRLDELMDSLQAYEMNQKVGRREEGMVLKIETSRQKVLQQEEHHEDEIAPLSKELHKMFR